MATQAVPDFFADASARFQSEDLTLDPEAEGHLRAIYSKAQERLERDIRKEGLDSIRQALDNQHKFLDALVLEAHNHGANVINRSIIDTVLRRLCPLYPFC